MKFARRSFWMLLSLCVAHGAVDAQDDSSFFRVSASPDAAVRAGHVLEFSAENDWVRTVEELQVLFEKHAGSVLPERFHSGLTSQYTLHPGAASWALETLSGLPAAARERYRERFADTAAAALASARADGDRRALTNVAERYPLTPAAIEALIALGDLELARGDLSAARAAWMRAARRASAAAADEQGLAQRLAATEGLAADALAPGYALRLPGKAGAAGPIPLAGGDRWQVSNLEFDPFDRMRGAETYSLFPVLADGRLLISTSLALYCLDAYSSELLWTAGPPRGWDDLGSYDRRLLQNRIGRSKILVAPSAGANVAVAALQVPTTTVDDHEYQGIQITGPIPERRLFAFDLNTGAPLWDHRPPDGWDGETGSYEQRMLIAAPPVVHGSRVIVPCYRMRGRIDYHVACYDLLTGARLWSTGVISGQDDLNMFGRQEEEFSGAPVVVDGDEVYVLTQLGTLARLDLFSGSLVWQARYEVIPIPKNDGWHETKRRVYWRNAPPVLTDDVVVATPIDSELLLAADRETGAILWSFDVDDLEVGNITNGEENTARIAYDVLLGADKNTVYLGGPVVSALEKPGGLHDARPGARGFGREPLRPRWSVVSTGHNKPRAVLGDDEVVITTYDERLVVDRRTGRRVEARTEAWSETDRGNVLIGDGVLVTVGNRKITAHFDWEVLLARAEAALARDPDGVLPRVEHAGLLLRRARAHAEGGNNTEARPLLKRARQSLAEVLAKAGDARAEQKLFEVLTEEARVFELSAEPQSAIESLTDALALAATPEQVRDTLLAQEALYRVRDPARWASTVAHLYAECARLPLPAARLQRGLSWLVGEALIEIAPADLAGADIPVGVWALFTQAEAAARSHDYAAAHAGLHDAITRFGDLRLTPELTVADVASLRIARRIELDGRAPFAAFEARAKDLLERATASRDAALLAEVGRLYPHSYAAEQAREMRLDLALEAGDTRTAADIAFARLGKLTKVTAADAAVLVRLADLFAGNGNAAFEQGVLQRLALTLPGVESPLPRHGGKTYATLARELGRTEPTVTPTASFGLTLARTSVRRGEHEQIGVFLAPADGESAPDVVRILLDRRTLVAHSSAAPGVELWSHELELIGTPKAPHEVVFTPEAGGRVIAGSRHRLIALDAATGEDAWRIEFADTMIDSLTVGSGVALVLTNAVDATSGAERHELHGIELRNGVPLWSLPLVGRARWITPITHDGVAYVLAPLWSMPSSVLAIDVTRGGVLREIDLGVPVIDDSWDAAWIEDGRLVIPFFGTFGTEQGRESRILAIDVESGRQAWSLPLEKGSELRAIAAYGATSYLVTRGVSSAGPGGEILALDVRAGRTRRVAGLKPDETTIGISPGERTLLGEPAFFTYTLQGGARTIPARMIPLDKRPGWVYQLQVTEEALYAGTFFAYPAVSDRTVAFVYSTRDLDSFALETARLELVDRQGGFHRGTLTLSPELSRCKEHSLYGLGDAILAVGRNGRSGGKNLSQVEVLETIR